MIYDAGKSLFIEQIYWKYGRMQVRLERIHFLNKIFQLFIYYYLSYLTSDLHNILAPKP